MTSFFFSEEPDRHSTRQEKQKFKAVQLFVFFRWIRVSSFFRTYFVQPEQHHHRCSLMLNVALNIVQYQMDLLQDQQVLFMQKRREKERNEPSLTFILKRISRMFVFVPASLLDEFAHQVVVQVIVVEISSFAPSWWHTFTPCRWHSFTPGTAHTKTIEEKTMKY